MEKRVGPWINKKIIEYIGEAEPSLTDFICNKVSVCVCVCVCVCEFTVAFFAAVGLSHSA